jgi:type IV secretory pathway VirB10-like protein
MPEEKIRTPDPKRDAATETADETNDRNIVDADLDSVVRGVGGTEAPKAKRIRPLAGLIVIGLVVIAAGYMQHGLKNRRMKKTVQADAPRAATGPATVSEKSWMDDQARLGLNTGTTHTLPSSMQPRTSITGEMADGAATQGNGTQGVGRSSIPPLQYTQTPVSSAVNGSLSFAEERRLELYKREQEAIESSTSIKGASNSFGNEKESGQQPAIADPLQSISAALQRARADQAAGVPQQQLPGSRGDSEQNLSDFERQNGQFDKEGFAGKANSKTESDYLPRARTAALGKFEVKSGWLIPAVLEQELNSDLPGMIRALVRENVYDSVTGQYLLIPAGSTLIGMYNSHVNYGQDALQAVWNRIIFPDGSSLQLGGFEGDDSQGATGYRDQVDSHWARLFSGALLTSLFAMGVELSQGQNSSVLQNQSVSQQAGAAVGQQVGQLGVEVTRRNLNIQPTIKVRPGYRFFVRVEKDILFKGPYTPMRAGE